MDAIAIIGLASRLPGVATLEENFWTIIRDGHRTAGVMPDDRLNVDAFYHPNAERSDTMNVRDGHFLKEDVAAFDAPFFSIQPAEAESMDPQQRMFLEISYQALENAGIPMEAAERSQTAVFFAASTRDYEVMLYRDPEHMPKYMGTGVGTSLLASRVSWFFNFLGPSVTLDTACSGSLTAIHLACQSLRTLESNMAVVGGGSLILAPEASMSQLSTLGFLSPDGRSYSFDSRANGYAKGEGIGVVILKRLDDAVRDGDTVRAVIRSTSINQDGRTPGITQPSKGAQTENIRSAYKFAGLPLDETAYFEAHGTGTPVGDPIEAEAIHHAFQRKSDNPLYIGALKSNIGHLEAGAGIAATIKSVLMLERGMIPPIAGFEKQNPAIPTDEWNLKFLQSAIPFPAGKLRRVSINSFGYGGTNAHAILDDASSYLRAHGGGGNHSTVEVLSELQNGPLEYVDPNGHIEGDGTNAQNDATSRNGLSSDPIKQPTVLIFSAADKAGVNRVADAYDQCFRRLPRMDRRTENRYLANLANTLSNRRSNLPWKTFAVVQTFEDLRSGLTTILSNPVRSEVSPAHSYVFTGQGAQWHAMARGLLVFPAFYKSLQKSQDYLKSSGCKWILMDELYKHGNLSRVDEPEFAQPLCTTLQIALVELLSSWKVRPSAVIGHSSGEIVAAFCLGAVSHESAINLAYHRGRVVSMVSASGSRQGGMMAVALSEIAVAPHLVEAMQRAGGRISVGCVNAPQNVTITGDTPAIETLRQKMDDMGIFARNLQVSAAYHSYHMEDLAEEYRSSIQGTSPGKMFHDVATQPVMFSSVTGGQVAWHEVAKPEYWIRNLVSTVRFSESLAQMIKYLLKERECNKKTSHDVLIEIGPHCALQRPVEDTVKSVLGAKDVGYDSVLIREREPLLSLASFAGRLRCRGWVLDLASVSRPSICRAELQNLSGLPEYQFNHSQSYWTESRISRGFKFRKYARHELLGVRESDWNSLQPKWRNIIRFSEHPWIQDHKFCGSGLFPAAGVLVMVIEACRQLAGPDVRPSGYSLSDISFPASFAVPVDAEIMEAQLYLSPHRTNNSKKRTTWDFQVFGYVNGSWSETCFGTAAIDVRTGKTSPGLTKGRIKSPYSDEFLNGSSKIRWEKVEKSQFYESLAAYGYGFGAAFQTLEDLRFTECGKAAAKVILDSWTKKVERVPQIAQHIIHPTDLDGIFQSAVEAYSQGGRLPVPILIPTKLKGLWISGDLLDREPGQALQILSKTTSRGYREAEFSMGAVDAESRVQIIVEGFWTTFLTHQNADANKRPLRSCYTVDWRPDIDLLSHTDIEDVCRKAADPRMVSSNELVDREELVSLFYMEKALVKMSQDEFKTQPPHLNKYIRWIKHQFDKQRLEQLRQSHPTNENLFSDDASQEAFLSQFSHESSSGKLIVTVGQSLDLVMNGELDALELLVGGENLLDEFYTSAPFIACFERLAAYVDLIAFKNPGMNILEVGAGTGSLTGTLLKCLTRYTERADDQCDIPRLQHYTFTDISSGFFEEAKKKFAQHSDRMTYATFNLDKDPFEQGFQAEQFDIVVASLVLHATHNLTRTLQSVRKVLKSRGKLILFESTAPQTARASVIFGVLPGWWLSEEEEREWSPLLDDAGWHQILQKNGFSGIDISLPDQADRSRVTFSGFVSTAIEPSEIIASKNRVIIVATESSTIQQTLARALRDIIAHDAVGVAIISPAELLARDFCNVQCISILEADSSYFENINEVEWTSFKEAVINAKGTLWVTLNCTLSAQDPIRALVKGLGRAIRSENLDAHFIELALSSKLPDDQVISHIVKVYRASLRPHEGLLESEFLERDGRLCIGRVAEATEPNLRIHNATQQRKPLLQSYSGRSGRALGLQIGLAGLLESLYFDDDLLHEKPLGPTEVEIAVKAAGVNFKDVLTALGQMPANVIGYECSGVVARAGLKSGYHTGEEVCACTASGSYKTFVRADASAVMKVPNGMPLRTAAGIPNVFATAYYSLVVLANIQEGESVLIHSGAGGVGQAAIQIAKIHGLRVFTTVGTEEKRKLLKNLYSIPDSQIFSRGDKDLASKIVSMTGPGIDVVLNSASGEDRMVAWSSIAPLGRFVDLTKADFEAGRKGLSASPFTNNVSFHSVSLDVVMERAKPLMRRIIKGVSQLFTGGKPAHAPKPVTVYPIAQIEQAFRYIQGGKSFGKAVIEMNEGDEIPVVPSRKPSYFFNKSATYVIAGGLGGLGRSMVEWMADRGAGHILLLSRSGTESNEAAHDLIAHMTSRGIQILAPRCDLTNEAMVSAVMSECAHLMPPIKGCIQGAMVLKDGLLESTSAADLHAVLRPKTTGTLNLANCLPLASLDFFVLLSSIAGMAGSRGQANYAMANTFQDAFARCLAASGHPCISLNLGSIISVGLAAERNLTRALRQDGFVGMSKAEFFALLEWACDPANPAARDPATAQLVTGLAGAQQLPHDHFRSVYWTSKPMFRPLVQLNAVADGGGSGRSVSGGAETARTSWAAQLRGAEDGMGATEAALAALVDRLARLLAVPTQDIDPAKAVVAFGIDSLIALELRQWVGKELRADTSILDIMQSESVRSLARLVAEKSELRRKDGEKA